MYWFLSRVRASHPFQFSPAGGPTEIRLFSGGYGLVPHRRHRVKSFVFLQNIFILRREQQQLLELELRLFLLFLERQLQLLQLLYQHML